MSSVLVPSNPGMAGGMTPGGGETILQRVENIRANEAARQSQHGTAGFMAEGRPTGPTYYAANLSQHRQTSSTAGTTARADDRRPCCWTREALRAATAIRPL